MAGIGRARLGALTASAHFSASAATLAACPSWTAVAP